MSISISRLTVRQTERLCLSLFMSYMCNTLTELLV